jgi:hypothetical protein
MPPERYLPLQVLRGLGPLHAEQFDPWDILSNDAVVQHAALSKMHRLVSSERLFSEILAELGSYRLIDKLQIDSGSKVCA